MNIENKVNFKIKNGLPTPESISQPLINLQSNDNNNVDEDHGEHNERSGKQNFISDKLLSSIINLSTLHESNNEDNNEINEHDTDRNKTGYSLESSPMPKNDSRIHSDNFEITLSKLIIKLMNKDKENENENENNNDFFKLNRIEFDEILKNLKLSFLKIKQLKMSSEVVKLDNNNKIERLELERNLLLKEIEVIKKRSTIKNNPSDYHNKSTNLLKTPITTTGQMRKIKIIETNTLSTANKNETKNENETSFKTNSCKENSSNSGTTFFHYYSTNKRQGKDFNSIDNRRNKRKKN